MIDKNSPLKTPRRRYIKRLAKTAERLRAQNSILTQQNKELQEIIKARRGRKKGRHVVLEGKIVLTTKELRNTALVMENQATKLNTKKKGSKLELLTPDSKIELKTKEDVIKELLAKRR